MSTISLASEANRRNEFVNVQKIDSRSRSHHAVGPSDFQSTTRTDFASSYDDFGTTGSFSGSDYSQGTCTIFTGPRQLSSGASLADNEFLLTINNNNGTELSLQGTFNTGGPNGLDLTPNPTLAESAFTSVLQAQADDPTINFQLSG